MRQGGLVRRFSVVRSGLATLVAVCVGVLGLGVVPAGAQSATIALSFTDTSNVALTSVGEDGGAQTVRVVATASAATSSTVSVSVTVGATGSTATLGATNDYTRSSSSVSVTIASGATTGNADVTITPVSDTVTENHEIIRFTGTATGYTVTGADLAITDADRTITLAFNNNVFVEGVGDSGGGPSVTDRTITATMSGATSTYSTGIDSLVRLYHVTTGSGVGAGFGDTPSTNWENAGDRAITFTQSGGDTTNQPHLARYIKIAAGATSDVISNNHGGDTTLKFVLGEKDRRVEPDRIFEMRATVAGFTVVPATGIVRDTDSDIAFTASPAVLAEGANGSGVTVSAAYASKSGGSVPSASYIGKNINLTVGVSGGSADAADFTYSPASPGNRIRIQSWQITSTTSSSRPTTTLTGLSIVDDDVVEGPETLNLEGQSTSLTYRVSGRDYTLQTVYSGQVTITDDDSDISLSLSTSSVREQAAAQEVTVTAEFAGSSSVLTAATDVTVTVAGGSMNGATLGATGDFTTDQTGNSFTVTIPAGSVSGSASFNITARDDGVTETAETVALSGAASVGGSAVTVTGASLTIQDNNAIALSLTDTSDGALSALSEDGSAETVRVVATAPGAVSSSVSVSVSVGASGSTASRGADYSAPSSATVTIASGATSGSADITFTPTSDTVTEGSETVRFSGSAPGRDVSPVDLTIADGDLDISLSVSPDAVPEQAGAQLVTVTAAFGGTSSSLTEAVDVVVTVASGMGASGATLGSSGDFTTDATGDMLTVTIAAGSVSGSGTFNITAPDEGTTEGVETASLSGSASVGGSAVTVTGVDLVIADTLIALSLTDDMDAALSSVGEDGGSETVRVVATAPSAVSSEVTVSVTVGGTGSTASRGADYSAPSSATVTIASGATSGFRDITVSPRSDAVTEDDETIAFAATASGYVLSQVTGAGLTINDADRTITLSWDDSVFPETFRNSGANAITRDMSRVVTASLSGATSTYGSAIDVPLSVTVAGALSAETGDVNMDAASVSIAAGAVSGTVTGMTIRVIDDRIAEPDETWAVTSTVAGFTVVDAQATIADRDSLVVLGPSTASLSEGSDPSGITVSAKFAARNGPGLTPLFVDATSSEHAAPADITLSVAAGSAQAADFSYAPPSLNQVSIAAGAVASTVSATLAGFGITDDDITEGPETLTLAGAVSGFAVEPVTLTVAASETGIALSLSQAVLAESASQQRVTVTAEFAGSSSGLASATAVTVTVTGTTATLGASGDFTTDKTGNSFTVTIPARRVSAAAALGVTARDDGSVETTPETASLSGAAMVGGAAAAVTGASFAIVDSFAELSVDDTQTPPNPVGSLREDAGDAELNLTFTVPSWMTVPVGGVEARFRVARGTARPGARADYTVTYPGAAPDLSAAYPGVVGIAAGASSGSVAFTLTINDDSRYEPAGETLTVEGFVPVSGIELPAAPVLLRISDNDLPPVDPGSGDQGSGPPAPAGCEGRFCDEDDSVHQANIDAIAGLGITLGCDQRETWRFCPNQQVTRRQMAAFLYRAVTRDTEDPAPTVGEIDLFDVPADAWYHTYAQWAVAQAGFAARDGEFEPAAEVPRSDMATMMATAFSLLPPNQRAAEPEGIFADMDGQPPAVVLAAEALYRVGVTIGCAEDPLRYCPDRTVTRAQMASFIVRALNIDPALTP